MEEIAQGIFKESTHQGRILQFTIQGVAQESIDVWYQELNHLISTWDGHQPYLVVYDMTHDNVSLTPYMRQKAAEIINLRQDVRGRVAILLKPSPFTYMFKFFLKTLRNKSRQTAIFFDKATAIKWLEQLVKK